MMKFHDRVYALVFLVHMIIVPNMVWGDVVVNPLKTVGPVKPMNAINNGPKREGGGQNRGNFTAFRHARIPYARTHDSSYESAYGGEHTVDISAIFPDFNRKVTDPSAYDFTLTDGYLKTIQDAGTKVFFWLGQRIEHNAKKYNIMPPKDFKKWAQICEYIIRHYTEGWNNGYKWDIQYWEIWNEPDGNWSSKWKDIWKTIPTIQTTWGGSMEQFFELYKTAALHLKRCFPNLKIGGPALAGNERWADFFLAYMQQNHVPIDFFSWHSYETLPEVITGRAKRIRSMLDKYGYTSTESILNEWNYVKGWISEYPYSITVMNGLKGAAFTAAVMNACQQVPVDMLMYYDARPGTVFDGLFDYYLLTPKAGYYAFYAWSKLVDYGQQVEAANDYKDIYVTATARDGKTRVMLARYNEDNNQTANERVTVRLASGGITQAISYVTDTYRMYTEVPVDVTDGKLEIDMQPNSFVLLEF